MGKPTILSKLPGYDIQIFDIYDFEIPSEEKNRKGIPQKTLYFNTHLINSDAIIIGLAEYNGTFTITIKNIFDCGSRANKNLFAEKPMLLLSFSPRTRAGIGIRIIENIKIKRIFPYFDARIIFHFPISQRIIEMKK
ncbi:NADPH-dependent FMN reductase [Myroides guanonis]|uniref:NADPH-dependent FMN reductase n=1 Tax=Myroides guanonis TaxID=1150112 RepID=A0A1I3LBQ7_9FLAO|nr:NAD(P)H-dependent oxidoreductase [Myroides guanonis]SFI82169.1 NADPH-dependent FMN reductase [Myroides guanonis]